MKPKEFDDLIRQKFDQNDFAYDPENWDRLAEKLDGRGKKRSMIMWWWAPLAGMAASVALAFGVSSVIREAVPYNTGAASVAHVQDKTTRPGNAQTGTLFNVQDIAQNNTIATDDADNDYTASANRTPGRHKHTAYNRKNAKTGSHPIVSNDEDRFGIDMKNAIGNKVTYNAKKIDLTKNVTKPENKTKQIAIVEAVTTFKPVDEVKSVPKLSVIVSGGYSHGNQNSGYMAGASIRRMVNDKVYVEGDVAFASSSNTQSMAYVEKQVPVAGLSKQVNTAKVTTPTEPNKATPPPVMADVIGQKDVSYDLYYAQVTPSIGYKLLKKMSIGVGPDFQKMLVDNRPAPSTVDRGTIQVAPSFDVGFVGKSEYALTKKVRAGVYYRKSVNNVITPMGKYIDRDYMQFQVKYTIFNK